MAAKRGKGGKNILKPAQTKQSDKIIPPILGRGSTNHLIPIFSFEHLVSGYEVQDCERDEKAFLLDEIRILSSLIWQQIMDSPKENHGYEMISLSELKGPISTYLTADVTQIMVFRYNGSSHRFAGIREDQLFQMLYIDPKLSLYDH